MSDSEGQAEVERRDLGFRSGICPCRGGERGRRGRGRGRRGGA